MSLPVDRSVLVQHFLQVCMIIADASFLTGRKDTFLLYSKKRVSQVALCTLNGSFECICCVHSYHEHVWAKQTLTHLGVGLVILSVNTGKFDLPVMGLEENVGKMCKSEVLSVV